MRRFKIFRTIIAIFVIAMIVGIPIVSAETAVINGAGRGTHTTFSGTSESEGSVSTMAGHSASASIGFSQVQTGKGSTSQIISGGSNSAFDPFATVEVGNVDVSVSTTVTGKASAAASSVAEARGYVNASADEDNPADPGEVNVTTSIASWTNATTSHKRTSAIAIANASGFARGQVSTSNGAFSLFAESDTEGATSAYARATGRNSHASADATIFGQGSAQNDTSSSTANSAEAALVLNGFVDGRGTASSDATGGSEVSTSYQDLVSWDFVATDAGAGGTASQQVSATEGRISSATEIGGLASSENFSDESQAILVSLVQAGGRVRGSSVADGMATAATQTNLTGNTAGTVSDSDGGIAAEAVGKSKSTVAAVQNEIASSGRSSLGDTAVTAVHFAIGIVEGSGSVMEETRGSGEASVDVNVSGQTIASSSDTGMSTTEGSLDADRGQGIFLLEAGASGFTVLNGDGSFGFGYLISSIDGQVAVDGTASGGTFSQSDGIETSSSANASGVLYGSDVQAYGTANTSVHSHAIHAGQADSQSVLRSTSSTGLDYMSIGAVSNSGSTVRSENRTSSGAALSTTAGGTSGTGYQTDPGSGDSMTGEADTGSSESFAGVEQSGSGYGEASSGILAEQTMSPWIIDSDPFSFFAEDGITTARTEATTSVTGKSGNYEGHADSTATTDAATATFERNVSPGGEGRIEASLFDPLAASGSAVIGSGYAEDESKVSAMTVLDSVGNFSPTGLLFTSGLLSLTNITDTSESGTNGRDSQASAEGAAEGSALASGSYENGAENGSTLNSAFGSVATDSFSKGRGSDSGATGLIGGLQIVGITTENASPETQIDNGILSATWSASVADAGGKNAHANADTGGFDQGSSVSGNLAGTPLLTSVEQTLDETSFSQTVGGLRAGADAHRNAHAGALAAAGSEDITGFDGTGNLSTRGGSFVATASIAETFGPRAAGGASASADDAATTTDGIIFIENPLITGVGAASPLGSVAVTRHSGLSGDATSTVSTSGGNVTVPNHALGLSLAAALQSAEVDPSDMFNGTSFSLGAFGSAALMQGRVNADADTSNINIASLASTSGGIAEPTSAQIFLTNGESLANLVGKPLSGESSAAVQTESLIGIGPDPYVADLIADAHSTTPGQSYAYGFVVAEATSDQGAGVII